MRFSLHYLTLVFVLFFYQLSFAQTKSREVNATKNMLAHSKWKVDGAPFETQERKEYALSKIDETDYQWGHFISFEETTFSSYYSAPCGNDCFTSVTGEYQFVANQIIQIKVLAINRRAFCDKQSEEVNKDYGNYLLKKSDTGWTLTKQE